MIKLGNIFPGSGQAGWVYDINGRSPTLVTFNGGGGKQPMILIENNMLTYLKQRYIINNIENIERGYEMNRYG